MVRQDLGGGENSGEKGRVGEEVSIGGKQAWGQHIEQ